jgi:hypothetical protein
MGVGGSADELLEAERQQGVDRSRSGAQMELSGGVRQPGPAVGPEQEDALLHGGEHRRRRTTFVLGNLEPAVQVLDGGVSGHPFAAPSTALAPSQGESENRKQEGAHRHGDEERVHMRPV